MLVSVISKADDDFGYSKKPDATSYDDGYDFKGQSVESFGGTFNVSSLGAATYTIPIDVPIGVGGMQPNLSITYDSQSSFGLLGLGFNLAGLSSITRGPKSVWQDGASSGISFDRDGAFYLDGERLIRERGHYSLSSSRLTEASFVTVNQEVNTVSSNGDSYTFIREILGWVVTSPDGTVSTYECLLPYSFYGEHRQYSWTLTRVEDKLGNYMTIEYDVDKENNMAYPICIKYGKNTRFPRSFTNSVNIVYDDIASSGEHHPFAYDTQRGDVTRRIKSIICKTGSSIYCSYVFNYQNCEDRSLGTSISKLMSVKKFNSEGEELRPIRFNWGRESSFSMNSECKIPEFDFIDWGLKLQGHRNFMSMDINGDGISDIIEVDRVIESENNTAHPKVCLVIYPSKIDKSGNVSFGEYRHFVLPGDFDLERTNTPFYYHVLQSMSICFADFNNDGFLDIFMPYFVAEEHNTFITSFFVYGARELYDIKYSCDDFINLNNKVEYESTNVSETVWKSIATGGIYLADLFLPRSKKYKLPSQPLYAAFDIDNDGVGNFLILETVGTEKNGYVCFIGTPNGKETDKYDKFLCFLDFPSAPKQLFTNDYNRDGLIDIMVVYDSGYSIYYNKGKENGYFSTSPDVRGSSLKQHDIIREGDFDGDGIADYFYIVGKDWYIAYGKGDGDFSCFKVYTSDVIYEQEKIKEDDDKFAVLVYDVDNDGRSDVFVSKTKYKEKGLYKDEEDNKYYSKATNPQTYTYLFRSNGKRGTDCLCNYGYYGSCKDNVECVPSNWFIGDFDGDAKSELLYYCENGTVWFEYNPDAQKGSLISHRFGTDIDYRKINKFIDALDNTVSVKYETLTNGKVYTRGTNADFPLVDYVMPIDVVANVKMSNGSLQHSELDYHYEGLKIHNQGRGILGFDKVTTSDKALGVTTTVSVGSYDSKYYTPSKLTTNTIVSKGNEKYETSSCVEYVTEDIGDKGNYFHHPVRKCDIDIYGQELCVDYVYDATNYVLLRETAYSSGENSMYKRVDYFYPPEKKTYKGLLKPLEVISFQKHYDDKDECVSTTRFGYDSNGLLIEKIDNYGTDKALTTRTEYDAFGNVTKTTVSGSDIKTKVVCNEYDYSNRFVELSYTDYLDTPNTASVYEYDLWGHLTYAAKFDNFIIDDYYYSPDDVKESATNVVRNEYDGWGNLVRTVDTFGNVKTVSKGWGTSPEKRYFVLTQGTHTPWVKTWYDSRGREVETESVGVKDMPIKTKTNYDLRGNVVYSESKNGDIYVNETIKYDAYGRVIKTIPSEGDEAETIYDKRKVTVKQGKKTVAKEFDSWGNTISVVETTVDKKNKKSINEITYMYNSNGNPSKIVSGDDVTTFEYDKAGNKTCMKTSDRGTITYKYNSLGECVYTKDGYIVHQNTQYDEQGRVIEKKSGAYISTYVYGEGGSGTNRLTSKFLKDSYGMILSRSTYDYDEYGRLKCTYDYGKLNNAVRTEYEYNSLGEISRICRWVSEKNFTVAMDYVYDCYGNRIEAFCNDYISERKPVWRLNRNTGKKVSLLLLGCNGLESEASFDNAGRLENSLVSYRGRDLSSFEYTYDACTGNMMSRTGMMKRKEMFDYDDNDRLTCFVSLDGRVQELNYSGNGNIINKSDLGTYRYQYLFKPNCLTQLDNEEGACPLDTREVSYNVWNRVNKIKDVGSGYEMQFSYDDAGNRNWSKLTKDGSLVRETECVGSMEHVKKTEGDEYFVYLGDNLMYHFNGHVAECLYLCTDHLGSIVKIVDEQGNVSFDAKYDAWGNQEVVRNDIGFIRGYIGQEEMPEFGLVNLNARLYDPMLGRFLSPDNFVQMPDNSQNYNRYAYCLNNPLKYNDPSGNVINLVFVAVAAYQAGLMSWANGGSFGDGAIKGAATNISTQAGACAISCLSSCSTYCVGTMFGHNVGSFWNEALRAGCHGLVQGGINAITGDDFWSGFAAGAMSSAVGSIAKYKGYCNTDVMDLCSRAGALASFIVEGGDGSALIRGAGIGTGIGALNHCGGDDIVPVYADNCTKEPYPFAPYTYEDKQNAVNLMSENLANVIGKTKAGYMRDISSLFGAASSINSLVAAKKYYKSDIFSGKTYWISSKGKFLSSDYLMKINGRYLTGSRVSGYRYSQTAAKASVARLNAASKIAGKASILLNAGAVITEPSNESNWESLGNSIIGYFAGIDGMIVDYFVVRPAEIYSKMNENSFGQYEAF